MKRLILLALMLFLSIKAATAQEVPNNCIPGVFSVSAEKKVYFSKGNLQYQPSSNTWRFAEQQYTLLDDDETYGHTTTSYTPTSEDWIDLFSWGMWLDEITDKEMITNTSMIDSEYSPTLTDTIEFAKNHRTVDGEQWFTLSKDEWVYLFNSRSTTNDIRYSKATVHDVNGLVLLPDTWNGTYTFANNNTSDASFAEISNDDWEILESEGVVFLPIAGCRLGMSIYTVGSYGIYWSSTAYSETLAYYLGFDSGDVCPADYDGGRFMGLSVRLVRCL